MPWNLRDKLDRRPQARPYHPPSMLDLISFPHIWRGPSPSSQVWKFCIKYFPQEHVACVIKSCNGTELILAHLNSLLGGGWLCLLKPLLVICESPVISRGLVSVKQAVARCLYHILFTFSLLCGDSRLSLSLSVSLFYILKLSVSWQWDNREATQHVERRAPQFHSRVQHTRIHWHAHVSIIPLC